MVVVESKRKKSENIRKQYPEALICDVMSRARGRLVKLSSFYLHERIPEPLVIVSS